MKLTNPQWDCILPLLSKSKKVEGGKGRPIQDIRSIINGIFWICSTGARWQDMPGIYPIKPVIGIFKIG
jgi:transposase